MKCWLCDEELMGWHREDQPGREYDEWSDDDIHSAFHHGQRELLRFIDDSNCLIIAKTAYEDLTEPHWCEL